MMKFTDTIDIIIPTCKQQWDAGIAEQMREMERTAGMPCRIMATCRPVCAAANRNLGLDWAESDVIIMVDDDVTEFPWNWAVRMVEVMNTYPDSVMCSPELLTKEHKRGPMMGDPPRKPGQPGVSVVPSRKLVTACIAIRKWPEDLRFDEAYVGSGFEDDDICAQLRDRYPSGEWLIIHDLCVVHMNEMKNQKDPVTWNKNRAYFENKWNTQWGITTGLS